MPEKRRLELLAPAKDVEVGIEAFNHGADAVYIGSPRFGARAAAGNSVADIERLARYGHQFGGRTMVALNTILTDKEVPDAQHLAWQLYEAGVDAFIVQDLSLFGVEMPPIELHASTQTDNRTMEKVRLMHALGANRVVLARELSVAQIKEIHEALPEVELECFVHGALCVCFSGQCYLSAALTGRSANRGECAQPCRLPMDLLTPFGGGPQETIVAQKHLLSLRDMNRSSYLKDLIDAGVSSFKIEGRLKDVTYVKNVVAYYRQMLDAVKGDYPSVSLGKCTYTFEPNPAKSFNRGFTPYFAAGERDVMWNHESPKSMGEEIGRVGTVGRDFFVCEMIQSSTPGKNLSNGDGLVADRTIGFRANRVDGNRVFPLGGSELCRQLKPGMELRRNLDTKFDQLLQKPSARRRIDLDMILETRPEVRLLVRDEAGLEIQLKVEGPFDVAQKPQREMYERQLEKLGDSIYRMRCFELNGPDDVYLPGSVLNKLRRDAVEQLTDLRIETCIRQRECRRGMSEDGACATGILPTDYRANIHNNKALEMASVMGLCNVEQSFENQPRKDAVVMQTKYCLKHALGGCRKYPLAEAEKVRAERLLNGYKLGDEMCLKIGSEKLILKFGCKNSCISKIMRIFAPENK